MSDHASQPPVRAGIVVTGNEVVNATIPDRNGPWISERLGERGVEVACIATVADRPDDLRSSLDHMRELGCELIVTTGGLGPTADDLTAEVVAGFTGRELRLDTTMEGQIASILEGYARRAQVDREALAVANRKQAMVPEGATALDPVGTAPGLVVPGHGCVVVVLPGPPRELQPMWEPALACEPVAELLARVSPFHERRLRLFGTSESEIARTLREIEAGGTPLDRIEITTCLRRGEIEVDLRWRDAEGEVAEAVAGGIAERHRDELFSSDGTTVDEIVRGLLHGRTLAVAESCTGGILAARLTDPAGASEHFAGGAVTYSNASKVAQLGVGEELIETHGAVSPQVAEAMAAGAMERFGADTAVALTGIAGPGGGSEEKPVGYVCFHALTAEGDSISRDPLIPGGRGDVRERSALVAMHVLRRLLS